MKFNIRAPSSALSTALFNMLTLHKGPCCLATSTPNKTDHFQSFFNLWFPDLLKACDGKSLRKRKKNLLAQGLNPVRWGQREGTHRSSSTPGAVAFLTINTQAHRGSGKLASLSPSCPGTSTELLRLLDCHPYMCSSWTTVGPVLPPSPMNQKAPWGQAWCPHHIFAPCLPTHTQDPGRPLPWPTNWLQRVGVGSVATDPIHMPHQALKTHSSL